MAVKNAADTTAKWSGRMRDSSTKNAIKQGVLGVQTSPMEQAAGNADGYVNGVMAAVQSGKWQAGLRRVSLSDWQQTTTTKGLSNLDTGVKAAENKMQAFLTQWLPFVDQGKQMVRSMPKATESDRKARMDAMYEYLKTFKRSASRF